MSKVAKNLGSVFLRPENWSVELLLLCCGLLTFAVLYRLVSLVAGGDRCLKIKSKPFKILIPSTAQTTPQPISLHPPTFSLFHTGILLIPLFSVVLSQLRHPQVLTDVPVHAHLLFQKGHIFRSDLRTVRIHHGPKATWRDVFWSSDLLVFQLILLVLKRKTTHYV